MSIDLSFMTRTQPLGAPDAMSALAGLRRIEPVDSFDAKHSRNRQNQPAEAAAPRWGDPTPLIQKFEPAKPVLQDALSLSTKLKEQLSGYRGNPKTATEGKTPPPLEAAPKDGSADKGRDRVLAAAVPGETRPLRASVTPVEPPKEGRAPVRVQGAVKTSRAPLTPPPILPAAKTVPGASPEEKPAVRPPRDELPAGPAVSRTPAENPVPSPGAAIPAPAGLPRSALPAPAPEVPSLPRVDAPVEKAPVDRRPMQAPVTEAVPHRETASVTAAVPRRETAPEQARPVQDTKTEQRVAPLLPQPGEPAAPPQPQIQAPPPVQRPVERPAAVQAQAETHRTAVEEPKKLPPPAVQPPPPPVEGMVPPAGTRPVEIRPVENTQAAVRPQTREVAPQELKVPVGQQPAREPALPRAETPAATPVKIEEKRTAVSSGTAANAEPLTSGVPEKAAEPAPPVQAATGTAKTEGQQEAVPTRATVVNVPAAPRGANEAAARQPQALPPPTPPAPAISPESREFPALEHQNLPVATPLSVKPEPPIPVGPAAPPARVAIERAPRVTPMTAPPTVQPVVTRDPFGRRYPFGQGVLIMSDTRRVYRTFERQAAQIASRAIRHNGTLDEAKPNVEKGLAAEAAVASLKTTRPVHLETVAVTPSTGDNTIKPMFSAFMGRPPEAARPNAHLAARVETSITVSPVERTAPREAPAPPPANPAREIMATATRIRAAVSPRFTLLDIVL